METLPCGCVKNGFALSPCPRHAGRALREVIEAAPAAATRALELGAEIVTTELPAPALTWPDPTIGREWPVVVRTEGVGTSIATAEEPGPEGGPRRWVFTVPGDVGRATPNRKRQEHWSKQREVAEALRTAARLTWEQAGRPVARGKVRVSYLIRRGGKELDPHAAAACLKHTEDGIFVGALTPDDSGEFVEWGPVTQTIGPEWSGAAACVVVTVEEVGVDG